MTTVVYSEDLDFIKTALSMVGEKVIVVSKSEVKLGEENHVIGQEAKEEKIAEYIVGLRPELTITGSTKRDKTVAGLVAGALRVPIIPEVIELFDNKAKRIVYSGMGIAELEFTLPIVITVIKKNVEVKVNPNCKVFKAELPGNENFGGKT